MEKIVLVTAGGHISSFHAGMKKMYERLEQKASGKFELFGSRGGLSGLIKGDLTLLKYDELEENRAGSLIGSDRSIADITRISDVVDSENIYAIIMMGGDNHLEEAFKLHKNAKIRIVGYPKTMDGDLSSFITLGWETAVTIGAKAVKMHHHSAITNRRVFYVGLFGRNTDWTLAGVSAYGGADRAVPCEQKYEWNYIWNRISSSIQDNKERFGVGFAVIPYSEGAKIDKVKNPPEEHFSSDVHGLLINDNHPYPPATVKVTGQ